MNTEHIHNGCTIPNKNWVTTEIEGRENTLRSEEVEEIIGQMPSWLIRQGTFLIFMLCLLLIAGAWYIHYPDVLITNVNITTANPPVKLIAKTSGKIKKIFTSNNESVTIGQPICLLDNTADYNSICTLTQYLNKIDTTLNIYATVNNYPVNQYMQLGECQPYYIDFIQAINQYLYFRKNGFVRKKTSQLQKQLNYYNQLNGELDSKRDLLHEQMMLEKKKLAADSTLLSQKAIAPLEFDNSKKALISQKINTDAIQMNIIENRLQQVEYQKNITDLNQQQSQQENDFQQKIRESGKKLQSQLEIWEEKYLIKSPVIGKTMFTKFWKENQYVFHEEAVLMIIPPVQHYVARGFLPENGAGKVKTGQKVLIKLAAYPYEEFGMIQGKVMAISEMAFDTAYTLDIQLNDTLITTNRFKLPQHPQLQGQAEILTNDKTILRRLLAF